MEQRFTRTLSILALCTGALAAGTTVHAQVVLNEEFTGGSSTTGFTITNGAGSSCTWLYAPGDLEVGHFDGVPPSGAGFDNDFAFIDASECSGPPKESFLTSPAFDASAAGSYVLTMSQQFRARQTSFGSVEVFNGSAWTTVAVFTGFDIGYPDAVRSTLNITAATGGSAAAQVRFHFNARYDWWWALDAITVERTDCALPSGLQAQGVSPTSAQVTWTDNGSTGYEWAVTTGDGPNGSNAVASGNGTNTLAEGLAPNTPYTVYIRSTCTGGTFSAWSVGTWFSTRTNDHCTGAPSVTLNATGCTSVTHGSVEGTVPSALMSSCYGNPDDDVWFSFVATGTTQRISLLNATGSGTDLYHAVWAGDCGSLTLVEGSCSDGDASVPVGLIPGDTYYLQVYTYYTEVSATFDVCIADGNGVGITELSADAALRVFPNPTSDQLFVTYNGRDAVNVKVMDLTGKPVLQRPMAKSIAVDGLAEGTYLLMVFDAQGRALARKPFVKQ